LQRRYRLRCLTGAGAAPVREQLVLVQFSPGEHEAKLSAAEAALDHLQRVDADFALPSA
jgi:hypothetical protein